MQCIDCSRPITIGHKRCNSCNAKKRVEIVFTNGWKKYEFNGKKYRSKWEVEFAKILTDCEIEFEYEVFDKKTKTRPDFYIRSIDRYIEIHPDYHGKKIIPDNCVLVKTLSHSRACALSIALSINKMATMKYIESMSKQALCGISKITIDLAVYIRQAIYERDEKNVSSKQFYNAWQPIETAPIDGTFFLGYRDGKVREAYRVQRDDCEMWAFGGSSGSIEIAPQFKPTHWMPLPDRPSEAHNARNNAPPRAVAVD